MSSFDPSVQLWLIQVAANVPAALVFVLVMSTLREPWRFDLNLLLVVGAGGAYLGNAFGPAEQVYLPLSTALGLFALRRRSYPLIGAAWLCHTGWDIAHHIADAPMWPYMPTSSAGCAVFDTAIAIWFFAGAPDVAPALWRRLRPASAAAGLQP